MCPLSTHTACFPWCPPSAGEGGQGDCGSSSTPVSPVNTGNGVRTCKCEGIGFLKDCHRMCLYFSLSYNLFLQLSSNVCSPNQKLYEGSLAHHRPSEVQPTPG